MERPRLVLAGFLLTLPPRIWGGVAPPPALLCPLLDERGNIAPPPPARIRFFGGGEGPEIPPERETPPKSYDVIDPWKILSRFWDPSDPSPPFCELSPTAPPPPPLPHLQCPLPHPWWLLALRTPRGGEGTALLREWGRGEGGAGPTQLNASLFISTLTPKIRGLLGTPQTLHCAFGPSPILDPSGGPFLLRWIHHGRPRDAQDGGARGGKHGGGHEGKYGGKQYGGGQNGRQDGGVHSSHGNQDGGAHGGSHGNQDGGAHSGSRGNQDGGAHGGSHGNQDGGAHGGSHGNQDGGTHGKKYGGGQYGGQDGGAHGGSHGNQDGGAHGGGHNGKNGGTHGGSHGNQDGGAHGGGHDGHAGGHDGGHGSGHNDNGGAHGGGHYGKNGVHHGGHNDNGGGHDDNGGGHDGVGHDGGVTRVLLTYDSATARVTEAAPGVLLLLGDTAAGGAVLEVSLQLPPLSVSDGGTFICSVTTPRGHLQQPLRLDVIAPPRVTLHPSHLPPGVPAELRCDAVGFFPLDVTVTWEVTPGDVTQSDTQSDVTRSVTQNDTKSDTKSDVTQSDITKSVTKSDTQSDVIQRDTKSDTESDTKSDVTQSDTKSDTQSDVTQRDTQSDTQSDTKSDTKSDVTQSVTRSDVTQSDTQSDTKSDTKSDVTQSDTQSVTRSVTGSVTRSVTVGVATPGVAAWSSGHRRAADGTFGRSAGLRVTTAVAPGDTFSCVVTHQGTRQRLSVTVTGVPEPGLEDMAGVALVAFVIAGICARLRT